MLNDDLMYYDVIGYDKNNQPILGGIWRYGIPYFKILEEVKELDENVSYIDIKVFPLDN